MKKIAVSCPPRFSLFFFLFFIIFFLSSQSIKANPFINNADEKPAIVGRWDMTVHYVSADRPSWLEVELSGNHTLVGRFVASGGSARPVAHVFFKDNKMNFSIPPQWEKEDNDLKVEGTLQGDSLTGTLTAADGKTYSWSAVRAPLLKRQSEPVWGEPIKLFNGVDMSGWHASGPVNQWIAVGGVMTSPHSGSNIITDSTFTDFKLHIEFRYPKESNSGVYLRGRYEVQIEDNKGMEPNSHLLGGVYGFLTPNEMVAKDPGEWQTYDITLVGRIVTVEANGKVIICNQIIPGITGGAIDSKEAEPGPIYLQGDHGPVEFRNIVITPAK
jgi:3-keto-disaccharide hydrolase